MLKISGLETLYSGQFWSSTQLIKPNYLIKGWWGTDTWCMPKTKMNFTERFMNLPTNVRGDLPPETYRTSEFLLSSCETFKISLKPCTLHIWSFLFYLHDMWNRIRTPFFWAPQFLQKLTPFFHFHKGLTCNFSSWCQHVINQSRNESRQIWQLKSI